MKTETRARILREGGRIIHRKGFNNTGILEILKAAGVPKGSFYFYFKSKEDFGIQLVEFYSDYFLPKAQKYLEGEGDSPLGRLRAFFNSFNPHLEKNDFRDGCPIGNLSQEMGDLNDAFRERLDSATRAMQEKAAGFLDAAVEKGELHPSTDTLETAGFILNSWQGALIQMKVAKSMEPLVNFDRMVFERLLRPRVAGEAP
jgi:TetR/AcrR family transcriptional repressor of nem operon